jgi:hypothetical protein
MGYRIRSEKIARIKKLEIKGEKNRNYERYYIRSKTTTTYLALPRHATSR